MNRDRLASAFRGTGRRAFPIGGNVGVIDYRLMAHYYAARGDLVLSELMAIVGDELAREEAEAEDVLHGDDANAPPTGIILNRGSDARIAYRPNGSAEWEEVPDVVAIVDDPMRNRVSLTADQVASLGRVSRRISQHLDEPAHKVDPDKNPHGIGRRARRAAAAEERRRVKRLNRVGPGYIDEYREYRPGELSHLLKPHAKRSNPDRHGR